MHTEFPVAGTRGALAIAFRAENAMGQKASTIANCAGRRMGGRGFRRFQQLEVVWPIGLDFVAPNGVVGESEKSSILSRFGGRC